MTSRIDGQTDEQAEVGAVNLDKLSPEGPLTRTDRRIRIVSHSFVVNWTTKSCVHRGRGVKLISRIQAVLPAYASVVVTFQ